jgi:hypothetical protein
VAGIPYCSSAIDRSMYRFTISLLDMVLISRVQGSGFRVQGSSGLS